MEGARAAATARASSPAADDPLGPKRKRPAMDRAIPSFQAEGPWARPRAQERAGGAALVAAPRIRPAAGRDLSGPGLYWPTLGSCCMAERPARRPGFHAPGCKERSLAAWRTPRVVTHCDYVGRPAQPVFSEARPPGNPAPPDARNAHFVTGPLRH